MKRKEFLQLAAGAAAFNIGGFAFGQSRARQIAQGAKIRLALIGCGGRLRSVLVTKQFSVFRATRLAYSTLSCGCRATIVNTSIEFLATFTTLIMNIAHYGPFILYGFMRQRLSNIFSRNEKSIAKTPNITGKFGEGTSRGARIFKNLNAFRKSVRYAILCTAYVTYITTIKESLFVSMR